MRGSNRLLLGEAVQHQKVKNSTLNLTKVIDSLAEDLILASIEKKLLKKKMGIKAFTVFSEELGIHSSQRSKQRRFRVSNIPRPS
jgi:hypothetical protein